MNAASGARAPTQQRFDTFSGLRRSGSGAIVAGAFARDVARAAHFPPFSLPRASTPHAPETTSASRAPARVDPRRRRDATRAPPRAPRPREDPAIADRPGRRDPPSTHLAPRSSPARPTAHLRPFPFSRLLLCTALHPLGSARLHFSPPLLHESKKNDAQIRARRCTASCPPAKGSRSGRRRRRFHP